MSVYFGVYCVPMELWTAKSCKNTFQSAGRGLLFTWERRKRTRAMSTSR